MTPTVALLGTLDTKETEYAYLRDRLRAQGAEVLLIDVGVRAPRALVPDVPRTEVAAAGGADSAALEAGNDRGSAVAAMAAGAAVVLRRLYDEGRVQGALAAGGSGNTTIAAQAMRALPVGVPKLVVSTMAGGDVSHYVGGSDLAIMPAVTDVAGVNRVSARVLSNAAAALAGMVAAPAVEVPGDRPLVGATMFGVTTPAVDEARRLLEERGYEVLVFHATGTGGRALEALVQDGFLAGVLDLTTTELCDELVGGVLTAGPDRLRAAGAAGVPQVVSLGALDMVNFGPVATVPPAFRDRQLYEHNASVTLMRTTADECAALGREIAEKLSAAQGPTTVLIPRRGLSALDTDGQPFRDEAADEALFAALRDGLGDRVELVELDLHVNDPAFAAAAVDRLDAHVRAAGTTPTEGASA